MNQNDEEIMLDFQAGNHGAIKELFERYKKPIFNFCYRFLDNRADAEDATADVFLALFKKKYTFEEGAKFKTWLYTVARNGCLTRIRRKRHVVSMWFASKENSESEEWEIASHEESSKEKLMKKETAKKVREAIKTLDMEQRQAILLREYQHCSYEQIANVLGCSLEKTKILIYRARERLKGELTSYIKGDTDE